MACGLLSLAYQGTQHAPYRPRFSSLLDRLDRPETVAVIPVSLASGCAGALAAVQPAATILHSGLATNSSCSRLCAAMAYARQIARGVPILQLPARGRVVDQFRLPPPL
jgi:hypothetical protein